MKLDVASAEMFQDGVIVVAVEDLRAWLKKNIKHELYLRQSYAHKGELYSGSLHYGKQEAFNELLAELSKTGGSKATREKPPPRSFI